MAEQFWEDEIVPIDDPPIASKYKKANQFWEDEEGEEKKGFVREWAENVLGTGVAGADILSGAVKYPPALLLGSVGSAMGERGDISREAGHQAMNEIMPPIGEITGLDKNRGYQAVMGALQWLEEKAEQGVRLISDDPNTQGNLMMGLDAAFLATPIKGKKVAQYFHDKTLPKVDVDAARQSRGYDPITSSEKVEPSGHGVVDVQLYPIDEPSIKSDMGPDGLPRTEEPTLGDTTSQEGSISPKPEIDIGDTSGISLEEGSRPIRGDSIREKKGYGREEPTLEEQETTSPEAELKKMLEEREKVSGPEMFRTEGVPGETIPYETDNIPRTFERTLDPRRGEDYGVARDQVWSSGLRDRPSGIAPPSIERPTGRPEGEQQPRTEGLEIEEPNPITNVEKSKVYQQKQREVDKAEAELRAAKQELAVEKERAVNLRYRRLRVSSTAKKNMEKLERKIEALERKVESKVQNRNETGNRIIRKFPSNRFGKPTRGFGGSQGGFINPDIIGFGRLAEAIKNAGNKMGEVYNKFRGTFSKTKLDEARVESERWGTRETLVWMKPSDFLAMAERRPKGDKAYERYYERKRRHIREGLNTDSGLADIPYLGLHEVLGEHRITSHEGRHRADVMMEQGVDYMPVVLKHSTHRWNQQKNPIQIRAENGDKRIDMPKRIFRGENPKNSYGGPGHKQGGSVDPQVFIDGIRKSSKNVKEFTEKLVEELGEDARYLGALLYHKASDSIEKSDKKLIPAQNLKTPKDPGPATRAGKFYEADIRPPEEVAREIAAEGLPNKDINKGWTEVLPGSNIAAVAKNHKAIRWLVDRALFHDRQGRMARERAKYGTKFTDTAGIIMNRFGKKIKTEDGALTTFEKMNWKDTSKAVEVWLEHFDGKDVPMNIETLMEKGLNRQQSQAVLAASRQMHEIVVQYNKMAEERGLAKINEIPNYFPHMWEGDYRVFVNDKKNQTPVEVFGAHNTKEANTIASELMNKFPDYEVTVREAASKFDIDDTGAFREALALLPKESAEAKILQNAYNEILTKRGFGKHRLNREGAGGFLGSEAGKTGARNSIRALESYIDKGYLFMANQRKKADIGNLDSNLKEFGVDWRGETPNAYDYGHNFIDHSTGGFRNNKTLVDNVVEGVGRSLGIGKNAGAIALSELNGTASAFWLSTPRFAFMQLAQPIYNLPKAVQLKMQGHTQSSISKAFMDSMFQAYIKTNAEGRATLKWARENGYIDAKFFDFMGMKYNIKGNALTWPRTMVHWGLGKIETNAVRTPTFLFYEKLLRDSIPDKTQRYHTAGYLTDTYMVNYTRTDTPLIYERAGIVGEAVRPLKQYAHAYWGQAIEYVMDMKRTKGIKGAAPFATFIGVQATLSGAKGVIGLAEATAIVVALNSAFELQIPTPAELMLTNNVPDGITFGGLSTLTGLDMGSGLAAPSPAEILGAPGIEWGYGFAKNVGRYFKNLAKGEATEADEMRALKQSPNWFHGLVEQAYTKPGQGVPNPEKKMIPDMAPRTKEEWEMRKYMGGRSMSESKAMLQKQELGRLDIQTKEQKAHYADVIIDRLENNPQALTNEIMQDWMARGGDPRNLKSLLKQRLIDKNMSWFERQIGRDASLSNAQKIQKLNKFRVLQERAKLDEVYSTYKEIGNK